MINTTRWDRVYWVQANQVRSSPIIEWKADEDGTITPTFFDLDDIIDGTPVIQNSFSGKAIRGRMIFDTVGEAMQPSRQHAQKQQA